MKPQDLPRASDVAVAKLEELEIEFRTPGKPSDAPEPPDLPDLPSSAKSPEAPELPELELPQQAQADVDIPAADFTDIFVF